jgi:hypothetical protein
MQPWVVGQQELLGKTEKKKKKKKKKPTTIVTHTNIQHLIKMRGMI